MALGMDASSGRGKEKFSLPGFPLKYCETLMLELLAITTAACALLLLLSFLFCHYSPSISYSALHYVPFWSQDPAFDFGTRVFHTLMQIEDNCDAI